MIYHQQSWKGGKRGCVSTCAADHNVRESSCGVKVTRMVTCTACHGITFITFPGKGDITVPALDRTVPDLAQLLITGLLNSYISPRHHSVSTCTKINHVTP